MPDRGNGKVLQFSTEQSIQREQNRLVPPRNDGLSHAVALADSGPLPTTAYGC
jgi:hypothetical protein